MDKQDAFLFKDPQAFSIAREMLKFHNLSATSLIVMLLRTKEKMLGSVVLSSEEVEKFNAEHVKLLLL